MSSEWQALLVFTSAQEWDAVLLRAYHTIRTELGVGQGPAIRIELADALWHAFMVAEVTSTVQIRVRLTQALDQWSNGSTQAPPRVAAECRGH
jgi:hypothetical protein